MVSLGRVTIQLRRVLKAPSGVNSKGLLIFKGGNINHREAAGLYRLYVNAKLRNPIGHFYTLIGYEQPSMLFLFARLYCSMKTKSICIPRR